MTSRTLVSIEPEVVHAEIRDGRISISATTQRAVMDVARASENKESPLDSGVTLLIEADEVEIEIVLLGPDGMVLKDAFCRTFGQSAPLPFWME